jgi:hypothetical protein
MFQWIKDRFAPRPVVEQPPEPVVVMICDGPFDAALFQAQLQAAGIPSALTGADSASMFGMQSGLLSDVRIVVPHEFADAAIALIADSIDNDYRDDDDSEEPSSATDSEDPASTPHKKTAPRTSDIDDSTDV